MSDDDNASEAPSPKIEMGRADLGPMVKALGDQMYADREQRRRESAQAGHEYADAPYQLAATIRQVPSDPRDVLKQPRWVVQTLGDAPHNIGVWHGVGPTRDAAVLSYKKRFSRLLLDRRVMGRDAAAEAGRRAEVHLVPILVDANGREVA